MKNKPIIGFYGYWVVLTYLSVISAMAGICLAISGRVGAAVICLVISGICDMFDGTVARTAKRNEMQKAYGIQIDSLADGSASAHCLLPSDLVSTISTAPNPAPV